MVKQLKNPTILLRKPNLKLKPNHYRFFSRAGRIFQGGKAISDGRGWYK